MKAHKKGEIEVDIRTLPPVMYAFATEELPILCGGGPVDLLKAEQHLNLFVVSVKELVHPRANK